MRPVTVGIVSIGDMGMGMAKLLKAHNYRVVTVAEGRRYILSLATPRSIPTHPPSVVIYVMEKLEQLTHCNQ